MPNILTDLAATYAASDVFSGTKTNAVSRLATESDVYVTAQWGEQVDADLQNLNSFLVGSASAGISGTFVSLLGGFSCAENVGVAGASGSDVSGTGLAVGDSSVDTNDIQIQSTVSSRILFSSPSDVDIGGLTYTHSSNSWTLRANNTDFAEFDSTESIFGTGAATYSLGIDGGSTSSQEPRLSFRQAGTEVASLEVQTDGRIEFSANGGLSFPSLTTVQRVALTQVAGHVVWDSDVSGLFVSNGTTWTRIVGGTGQYFDVTEYGAVGDGVTDDYSSIASALTAANAAGSGVVYFPPGTYLVSQTLRRPTAVSMWGAGVPGTIIQGDNLTSQPVVGTTVTSWVSSPTVRAGFIKNFVIDNQDRANAGAIGLELAGSHDCVVEGVTVQNVETGVSLIHSSYWNELRSVRAAVVDVGFQVTNGSHENALYSCHVVDCEVAFEVSEGANSGCSNTSFIKCAAEQFNAGSQYGYSLSCSTANAVDTVLIDHPRLERSSSGGTGVNISGTCRNVTVENPLLVNITTPISGALTDTRVTWRGQEKRGIRIGVLDDYSVTTHSLLYYSSGYNRPVLRNSANSNWADLHIGTLYLQSTGTQIATNAGTPEGSLTAGRGSICADSNTGDVYSKTTTSGNTGWVQLGGGGGVYSDNMGWNSSSVSPYYLPVASGIAESSTLNMQHIWRAPVSGTISQMVVTCTSDPGSSTMTIFESDGSTSLDTDTQTTTTFTFGAGTGYQLDFSGLNLSVSEGDLICFQFDPTTGAGQASAFLIIDL